MKLWQALRLEVPNTLLVDRVLKGEKPADLGRRGRRVAAGGAGAARRARAQDRDSDAVPADKRGRAGARARTHFMIHNPDIPAAALVGRTFESAAGALGVEPTIAHIHGLADIELALGSAGAFSRGGRGPPAVVSGRTSEPLIG